MAAALIVLFDVVAIGAIAVAALRDHHDHHHDAPGRGA
jgi:hypothetical protein